MPTPSSAILIILILWLFYIGFLSYRNIESWKFLFKGREMIREKARSSRNAPFSLPIFGFGDRMHIVSTTQHWSDLKNAHMFQPKYSLLDEWPDRRDEEGMPIIRAIRTMSNHLPVLKPKLLQIFQHDLDNNISRSPTDGDFSQLALLSTVEYLVVRANTLFILGEDTANDRELVKSGIAYTKEVTIIGEVARLMPTFLTTVMAKFIKGQNKNQKYVLETMMKLVDMRRKAKQGSSKTSPPKPKTILEAFVDTSPDDWSTREVIHHLNIMWTTTTLSLGVVATQFIEDLCYHKTYIPDLIHQLQASKNPLSASSTRQGSLLESFLMESMRTHCFQSTAVHRTALRPFTFTDGYTVPIGESVQFYQEKVHFDENRYDHPETFDPYRFYGSMRTVTDVGMEWPFWGVGKNACPGRFFFSYMVKVLAEYLLINFDFELKDSERKNFTWGENNVPNPRAVLRLRRKATIGT